MSDSVTSATGWACARLTLQQLVLFGAVGEWNSFYLLSATSVIGIIFL